MKKLLKIITGVTLSLAMAIGVGVGVANNNKKAEPVYATGSSATLTAYNALEDGCYYMITDGAGHYLKPMAFAGKASANANGSYTYSNGSITIDESPALTSDAWYFESSNDGWIIKDSSSDSANTLYFINDNNGVACGSTSAVFTANNGGSSKIKFTADDTGDNNRYLSYASGNFRCYKTGTTGVYNLSIYKIVEEEDKTPASIALSGTYPTQFYQNDSFSHEGMTITVTYTGDDGTANVTPYALFSGYNMSQIGQQTVTVSYTENNTTVTTTYSITINAPRTLSSIAVSTPPTKTVYYEGEEFDPSGMVVTATYSDASTDDVTASCTFSPDPLTESTNAVTISYGGQTTTQAVTVNSINEVTFSAGTDIGTSSGQNDDTITKLGISMHCTSMHDTDSAYRYYKDSTLTFTSTIGNMSSIEFTGNDNNNKISNISTTASTGTVTVDASLNTASWSGNSNTVSFTMTAQGRASEVIITIAPSNPTVVLDKNSVNLKTSQNSGVTVEATVYNVDTPSYSWTSNNGNINLENSDSNIVTIKPTSAGESIVTLTVGGVTPNLTATVNVTITVPEPGETIGTAFTVSEAIAHIDSVINGGEESGNDGEYYYARGIVSEIVTPYNSQFGNITYNISADGETSSVQLQAYRGKGLNGNNFESENDIEVGATVVIYGNLKKHNDTYEFDSDNQLASYTAAPRYTVTFDSLGGSSVDPAQNVKKGTCISPLPVATKANDVVNQKRYELAGWYTVADPLNPVFEEGNRFTTSTPVNSNLTVYAKYNEINYYVVTFNTNGGSPIEAQNVDSGDTVAMPNNPTKASDASNTYTFEGWYTNAGLSDPFNGSEPITGNLTVYAKYTAEAISNPGSYLSSATSITTLHASETSADSGTISKTLAEIATANNWTTAAGSGTQPCYTSFNLNSNVQVSTTGSANCGSFWGSDWRLYQAQGGNVIISVSNGYKLTSVTFTYTVSNSGILKHGDDTLSSGTPFALTESTETFDVLKTGSGTNGQIRITNISVSYERALSVSNVAIRFGASIAKTEWDAINEHVGWQISDYGVMLMKASDKTSGGYTSVEDAYNKHASDSVLKIINKCAGGADYEDPYQDGDNYLFTVKVSFPNIPTNRNYINDVIYAVPFVVVGEQYYFLTEMHTSIHDLAESYLGAGHEYLSNAALGYLMGN